MQEFVKISVGCWICPWKKPFSEANIQNKMKTENISFEAAHILTLTFAWEVSTGKAVTGISAHELSVSVEELKYKEKGARISCFPGTD